MSQANAAARKRRAGGSSMPGSNDNIIQQQQQQQPPASGLTLPQVIALVDRRLVVLETFMKETKTQAPAAAPASTAAPTMDDEFVEDINSKFEMLANEIADLKDMLLKLQTFTMEVNKRLVDERIQLLSDVKVGDNVVFDLSDDNE
jgi:hypothetical protein